ncbi:MAG: hypothetical protein WBC85_16950 [Planktotalea sp.]|uniref:hypothetical protein n=1 Tax=Planktotalea sp. TaxID=2029877 RepID=UPI003C76D185
MSYTPNMNALSQSGGAYSVDQREIQRVLDTLIARQSGNTGAIGVKTSLPGAAQKASFEGWKRGQLEFARRLAQISARHAAKHKHKFCWKHHSIGLLRRLALVVMVATILSAQYL